ncbi:MAG: hypothetical protein K2K80_02065 [Clostridia bacterium]|nr:hypothetical protein [Clostridia bacterium]
MEQKPLNDKLIAAIIENASTCNKREEINQYISEVSEMCAKLCREGEHLRVLGAYKFMIDNLRKRLNL